MNKRTIDHVPAAADVTSLANSLLLLSSAAGGGCGDRGGRVFTCKTCNKQFTSFQALGGHRASHKKPKLAVDVAGGGDPPSPAKSKTHECSICGMEFPIGQALGGHMRRHRESIVEENPMIAKKVNNTNNSRKVLCLDLNLTPLENKFVFGKLVPAVDCFF